MTLNALTPKEDELLFKVSPRLGSLIKITGEGSNGDGHKVFSSTKIEDGIPVTKLFKDYEKITVSIECYCSAQESVVHTRIFKKGEFYNILNFIKRYEDLLSIKTTP